MNSGGFNWTLITIIGPVLLLAVLAWAVLRNRASRESRRKTEEGTRGVYAEEERARRTGDDGAE